MVFFLCIMGNEYCPWRVRWVVEGDDSKDTNFFGSHVVSLTTFLLIFLLPLRDG